MWGDTMTTAKRRTNVTIAAPLLDAARDMGLNVSAISEAALAEHIATVRAATWEADNSAALKLRADWIDRNGPPLAKWQVWTAD